MSPAYDLSGLYHGEEYRFQRHEPPPIEPEEPMSSPLVLQSGFHLNVSAKDYHADPCERPSLSSTIAKELVAKSPRHAWLKHPRLGAAKEEEDDEPVAGKVDKSKALGTLIHRLMLGKGGDIVIIREDSFRTNLAKAKRDDALLAGKIPVLEHKLPEAQAAADSARGQLDDMGLSHVFKAGMNEVVVVWKEGDFYLRAMIDNLIIDEDRKTGEVWDLKTVGRSSHPQACAAQISALGYDLSAAFYRQGVGMLRPELNGRIKFRWIFLEVNPPYAVTPVEIDGEWEAIALSHYCRAVDGWKRCLAADKWPFYVDKLTRLEPKPWLLAGAIGAEEIAANVA